MYLETPQGSKINIQGLDCWIPPEGHVFNIATKQIEFRGVHKRSDIVEEQYWERIPLPTWYKDTMKRWDGYEKKKKDDDDEFYDESLEEYKKQEWDRRLNGHWFYNNGIATFLTGAHYMFLQWWQIDIGYPSFRIPDLEYFYFQQYCIEDPLCMGMLEITKRRFGKTFRGGLFVTEYPTRTKMTNGGIQSKTGHDAKKVFAKAVINPFKKLPRFFRPEYDMSLGITPKSEIRFQQTNVRGKKAEDGLDKDELGSMIDHQSADVVAYDGQKIHRYFGDEWAKTVEANVYDRHDVIRYCLLDDEGNVIGKALYSTTVEQLESEKDGVQEAAIQLWNDSNQENKGKNGRTPSGLYRFFMTADRAKNFDKYGIPNVQKTIKEILEDRETVKHNQRAWAARVRKEARTIDEAFYAGNDKCEFNAENVQNQIVDLKNNPVFLRQVRLIFENYEEKSIFVDKPVVKKRRVKYMDDAKGGWFLFEEPIKPNNFIYSGAYTEPKGKALYQIGVDTTQDRIAIDGSNPAICVFKKSLIVDGTETGLYPVALWISPTRLDIHFDEEVLKASMYWGCTSNYEIDRRTDFYRFFCKENSQAFLEWTPKIAQNPLKRNFKPEYGTRSGDPFQLAAQLQVAKMYIDGTDNDKYNGHVHRIKFIPLLEQLLMYDHLNRTKSDLVVSLMMALLPIFGEAEAKSSYQYRPKQILPKHAIKISA